MTNEIYVIPGETFIETANRLDESGLVTKAPIPIPFEDLLLDWYKFSDRSRRSYEEFVSAYLPDYFDPMGMLEQMIGSDFERPEWSNPFLSIEDTLFEDKGSQVDWGSYSLDPLADLDWNLYYNPVTGKLDFPDGCYDPGTGEYLENIDEP